MRTHATYRSNEKTREISKRIAPVIQAVAERIHYAESRRANYSITAGGLIAAGITILTFSLGSIETKWIQLAALFCAISMTLLGGVILYKFGAQTNHYPFTEATKTWKWFYRDALPDAKEFDLNFWKAWSRQKKDAQKAYSKQLPIFEKQIQNLSSASIDLNQDIQQLYVLHINEKYKNIHLSQLRSIFNIGIIVILFATIIGALIGTCLEITTKKIHTLSVTQPGWTAQVQFRLIPHQTSDAVPVLVHTEIKNYSRTPIKLISFTVSDVHGWRLPVEVQFSTAPRNYILPKKTLSYTALLKVDREIANEIVIITPEIK